MNKIYKWGIIGPGKIAQKFAAALAAVPDATLHAVGSRDINKARQFAGEYKAPFFYGNYEAIAAEKPMSVNYASTLEMVVAARQNKTFLMEAMWTRFLPIIDKTLDLIKKGEIGALKYLRADFGFVAPFDANSRLYNLQLGGGSLLDVGVYPLFLALLIMGRPDEIKSFARLAATGADETTNALLYYKNGMMASVLSSIAAQTPITAEITGTEGTIILDRPWYKGTVLHVRKKDTITQTISLPYGDNGFEFQVQEVQQCLQKRFTESLLMPLDFSLLMSSVTDEVCKTAGITYKLQPAL